MPLKRSAEPISNDSSTDKKVKTTSEINVDDLVLIHRTPAKWAGFGKYASASRKIDFTFRNLLGRQDEISLWDNQITERALELISEYDKSLPNNRPVVSFSCLKPWKTNADKYNYTRFSDFCIQGHRDMNEIISGTVEAVVCLQICPTCDTCVATNDPKRKKHCGVMSTARDSIVLERSTGQSYIWFNDYTSQIGDEEAIVDVGSVVSIKFEQHTVRVIRSIQVLKNISEAKDVEHSETVSNLLKKLPFDADKKVDTSTSKSKAESGMLSNLLPF